MFLVYIVFFPFLQRKLHVQRPHASLKFMNNIHLGSMPHFLDFKGGGERPINETAIILRHKSPAFQILNVIAFDQMCERVTYPFDELF